MIYLASPYSHEDPAVEHARFEAVVREAALMWRRGLVVFSPIAHSHPIALHGVSGAWEQWAAFDEAIIGACSELWVLKLQGWETSRGIAAEVGIAERLGLPVQHVEPTPSDYLEALA